eukprot:1820681-Pleurochrysis_carterae.AAC.1
MKDGRVLFTDGRDVARRTSRDGPIEIQLLEAAGGSVISMPADQLVALSDAALPGVLTLGKRKGTNAMNLRWKGMPVTLSPVVNEPLAQAAGVR